MTKKAIGSLFWREWEEHDELFKEEGTVDFFNQFLDNSLSDENIREAMPYLNDNGQLCIITKVYSLAGADYYWHDINLEDFELVPYYNQKAELRR